MFLRIGLIVSALFALNGFVTSPSLGAAEPLHVQVDRLIERDAKGPVSTLSSDAEFLRRIYLDVLGRIPTVSEARAFLDDKAADKRTKLIDKLFASLEQPRRLEELLTQMLMERRGDDAEWIKFVRHATETNMPWDQFVRAILKPNADDETSRGSAYFYVNRLNKVGQQETDYAGLTRDVGRMFLGVDLQCAQCHNHLFVDDYKQVEFQGLYTVYLNTTIRPDVKFPAVSENLMTKKIDFQSVFDKKPLDVGPRVPFFKEVSIQTFDKGEEYTAPPDKKTRFPGLPKFSPLQQISELLASSENRSFAENAANRFWYTLMGRGVVFPLDMRHSANPPSHPELLKLLTDDLLARKFDVRGYLKELTLSKTYQRTTAVVEGQERPAEDRYRVAIERPLWAEQILWSTLTATGNGAADFDPRKSEGVDDVRKKFVVAFANPAKEPEIDFAPSVKAALFVLNEKTIFERLKPANGNLIARVSAMTDSQKIAEEIYLAVLTRLPTAEETKDIVDLLAKAPSEPEKRARTLGHIAWALLASTEFCLNH